MANDAIMTALANAIGTCVPYVLFIALAERVINILRKAFVGREAFF